MHRQGGRRSAAPGRGSGGAPHALRAAGGGRGESAAEAPGLVRRRRRRRRHPKRITTDVLPPGRQLQRKWTLQRSPTRAPPRPTTCPPGSALKEPAPPRPRPGCTPSSPPVSPLPSRPPALEAPPPSRPLLHSGEAARSPAPLVAGGVGAGVSPSLWRANWGWGVSLHLPNRGLIPEESLNWST